MRHAIAVLSVGSLAIGPAAGQTTETKPSARGGPVSPVAPGETHKNGPLFEITIARAESDQRLSQVMPTGFRLRAAPLREIVAQTFGLSSTRVAGTLPVLEEKFDLVFAPGRVDPAAARQILQQVITETFDLQIERRTRTTQLWVLSAPDERALKLSKSHRTGGGIGFRRDGRIESRYTSMQDLARELESVLEGPVLDETHLEGRYDFSLASDPDEKPEVAIPKALRAAVSLDLKRAERVIEVLSVEKRRAD